MIKCKFYLLMLTFGFLNSVNSQSLSCPKVRTTSGWLDLFPLPCQKNSECRLMSAEYLCCKGFCTKGIKSTTLKQTNIIPNSTSVVSSNSSPSTSTLSSTTTRINTSTATFPPSTKTSKQTTAVEAISPFFQLLPIQRSTSVSTTPKMQSKPKKSKTQKLVCPKSRTPVLFAIPCEKNSQCRISSGSDHVCCDKRCMKGVPAPRPTPPPESHQPLLGVIPRECPSIPLGELLFEVQTCKTDADCWPRLCCPDGIRSYCRTARPRLDLVPGASQINQPVRMLERYLQCTPPPQLDLFPQSCNTSVDCFPNLCCAENGKKFCRPAQRSVLALLAGVTQRVTRALGNLRQVTNN